MTGNLRTLDITLKLPACQSTSLLIKSLNKIHYAYGFIMRLFVNGRLFVFSPVMHFS